MIEVWLDYAPDPQTSTVWWMDIVPQEDLWDLSGSVRSGASDGDKVFTLDDRHGLSFEELEALAVSDLRRLLQVAPTARAE